MKLSVVLATKNEEANIGSCLESIKDLAEEIIIFDEGSTDKTVEIAGKYKAKITNYVNKSNFHETKQKAIESASGDWILQLDADERVTTELAQEIRKVIKMNYKELKTRKPPGKKQNNLFERHLSLIEKREGKVGKKTGDIVAFFIPRLNFFLGAPLHYTGVYPDGVIRLFKKGKARLPGKSVHELMEVDGEVAWLFSDLQHDDSPTFERYFERANRYTDLTAQEYINKKVSTSIFNLINYSFLVPGVYFLRLYFLHRGYKDGMRGFLWSFFSALHYPIAYFKYWQSVSTLNLI